VVQALATAHELARRLGDERGLAWAAYAEGFCCLHRDRLHDAVGEFREAERRFTALGPAHAREASMVRIATTLVLGNYGVDLGLARRLHVAEISDALERGDLFAANWARVTSWWLETIDGNIELGRQHLAATRSSWPRIEDSLFATSLLIGEILVEIYVDPESSWTAIERMMPEFRALYSSWLSVPRMMCGRLIANSAMAAYYAGLASRELTEARIAPVRDDVRDLVYGRSAYYVIESHLCALAGDRAGCRAWLLRAASTWREHEQLVLARTAELRIAELDGDEAAATRARQHLTEAGLADPERFTIVYAGPRPFSRG
jgi:hypothetical protein